ncbi:MAG: helix-turn-helix domain-containing protein [Rhodoferax sp.]
MLQTLIHTVEQRLLHISAARRTMLMEGDALAAPLSSSWIERSWQRCLDSGHHPNERLAFDGLPQQALRQVQDSNRSLVDAARPVMERLGQAIADTRYFAILTNAQGIVVDVNGPIDRSDRRADVIARIGVNLSEAQVGTTTIGAALFEGQAVWLHRGEHFFEDNAAYSCAGAPLFGPDGHCVGMLDLTGVDVLERPELKHLVSQTAGKIENAMVLARPHHLLLRLNWPGYALGGEGDGMICLDSEGWVTGANATARTMASLLQYNGSASVHATEVFGIVHSSFFDAANRDSGVMDVPLWNGLHLQVLPILSAREALAVPAGRSMPSAALPLKDMETALIRKAVEHARGNVAAAAKTLGISRATVYRKLGQKR